MKSFFCFSIFSILISFYGNTQNANPEYATVLSEYIQYPSEEYKEKEAGLFFLKECQKKGLYTEILTSEDSAFNFISSLYPLSMGKPNIIFLNHIDVVPPGDTVAWQYPAYSGEIRDSVIWGRGSIDNKGMAVAQLFALSEFVSLSKETNLPYNISILSVAGEETDGHAGAKIIAENFLKKLNPYLIVGEGGSGVKDVIASDPDKIVFGISTVEKSKIILQLAMDIPSIGHGSVPPKEYAMKEMIFALEKLLKKKPDIIYHKISVRALKELGKYEKGIRGHAQRHFTFLFFKPFVKREIKKDPMILSFFANTIAFTKLIIPEGTDNMISHNAKAVFDCRLLPGTNYERFIRKINKLVKDERIKITVISQVLSAEKTNNAQIYEYLTSAIHSVYPDAAVVEMIFPATTDNNYFRAKGIPVFGIFPACFTNEELMSIHGSNEKIHFNRMEDSILVYKNFIDQLLQSNFPLKASF